MSPYLHGSQFLLDKFLVITDLPAPRYQLQSDSTAAAAAAAALNVSYLICTQKALTTTFTVPEKLQFFGNQRSSAEVLPFGDLSELKLRVAKLFLQSFNSLYLQLAAIDAPTQRRFEEFVEYLENGERNASRRIVGGRAVGYVCSFICRSCRWQLPAGWPWPCAATNLWTQLLQKIVSGRRKHHQIGCYQEMEYRQNHYSRFAAHVLP